MKAVLCVLCVLAVAWSGSSLFGQAQSQTLFTSQAPALVNNSDGANVNYELGMQYESSVAGQITAIRYWKDSDETGTHTGNIWSASGALLASATFTDETPSGWQQQNLTVPLSIAANTVYVVSVNTGNTYYVDTVDGLAPQIVNVNLASVVGNNGVFGLPGQFPTNSWNQSNYFRDVVFAPAESLFTVQAPALTGDSDGVDANYELGTLFQSDVEGQITAVRFWKDARETGPHTGNIWSASGDLLASVSFNNETASGWQQQALTTPLAVTADTVYVVSVNTGNTYYVDTIDGLSSQVVDQDLASVVGNNGVFGSPGQFPTNSWNQSNYFRDVVFSPQPAVTSFAVSGTVSAATGVTLSLSGATTATVAADASGAYSFTGLADGVYAVTPTDPGYVFIPPVEAATVSGANVTLSPFVAALAASLPPAYSVSGVVTPSSNGSGTNAIVTLSGSASAATVADGTGAFVFGGLPNGVYTVTASAPGALFTPSSQTVTVNGASVTGANFSAAALVLYDAFSGSSLNSQWFAMNEFGDVSNNEVQCYLPSQVTLNNALLITTAAVSVQCGTMNTPSSYSSGKLAWATSTGFTYGTIEFKAQLPGGIGTWPAIWLLGENCQPASANQSGANTEAYTGPCAWPQAGSDEIDIAEILNSDYTSVNQQIHAGGPVGGPPAHNDGCTPTTTDTSLNYHVYDLVWSPGSIVWEIDGVKTCVVQQSYVPSTPMFLIIDTAVGGNSGPIDNTTLPKTMTIDYVQVTQP